MNEVMVMPQEEPKHAIVQLDMVDPMVLVKRRQDILAVTRQVMKKDIHYGEIPGTGGKPTLLKPGAEVLCSAFRLSPSYDIITKELDRGHREYQVLCKLTCGGNFVASGIGSCSSMESKYRYRNDYVNTGEIVPKSYWDHGRDASLIGGKGFVPKKVEGKWLIHKKEGKKENEDPFDQFNTVLKMAKKRAQIDAVLSALAISDLYTQDIEDMNIIPEAKETPKPKPKETKKAPPKKATKDNVEDLYWDEFIKKCDPAALKEAMESGGLPPYKNRGEFLSDVKEYYAALTSDPKHKPDLNEFSWDDFMDPFLTFVAKTASK